MSLPISAIIITKNEEATIGRCLSSLTALSEVVLLDSHSTDTTRQLAQQYPNTQVHETDWLGYAATKQQAVQLCQHDWILWVDADEVLTNELMQELKELTLDQATSSPAAYDLPRKTFFLGHWVQHTGWYPGRVVRLFNRRRCHFNENLLHEGLTVNGAIGQLQGHLLHYSYTSLYQYFDKMNSYGRLGAQELQRRGKRFHALQLVVNPSATFIKFFFFKAGYKDGMQGFIIAMGSAFSNFIKYVNFYYLQQEGKQP